MERKDRGDIRMRARLRRAVRRRGLRRGPSREGRVEAGRCVWLGIWVRLVRWLGSWALEGRKGQERSMRRK